MRLIVIVASMLSLLAVLYRYRYRILQYIISVGVLRKGLAIIIANIPQVKRLYFDSMFNRGNMQASEN
ncbi:MAG: hypothetical protein H0Z32_06530 [Bacillaceae bacterium]|nr:hypothetical protein [Bacillaceae bacterium]